MDYQTAQEIFWVRISARVYIAEPLQWPTSLQNRDVVTNAQISQ